MIIKYILPILALSLVIAIHELGHLITAKLFKVKVEVFSIGIGKKIFKHNFKGTEYTLSLIPLGGYCKLKGGDIQNPIEDSDSIDQTHPLKKVAIFFAGPFFNLILTFILMSIILLMPVHQKLPTTILPVLGQQLPAETGGLIRGDRVISINGYMIETFGDISKNINNEILTVIIDRDNKEFEFKIEPKLVDGKRFIGVYPFIPLVIYKDSNGLFLKNDIIVAVDNIDVDNYFTLMTSIGDKDNISISYMRDGIILNTFLGKKGINSISFTETYSHNLFNSIIIGGQDTAYMLTNITKMFFNLFKTGEVTKSISSPLRLVYEVGNSIDGIYQYNSLFITIKSFLTIMASISLTLGFINMLPIPILDGGQILLNVISAFKGSPISRKFIYAYQTAGLIIVLLLFTLGISNDIFFFGDLK